MPIFLRETLTGPAGGGGGLTMVFGGTGVGELTSVHSSNG